MNWIRRLLAAPVFEDEDKTRAAALLNTMLLMLAATSLLGGVAMFALDPAGYIRTPSNILFSGGFIGLAMVLIALLRYGYVHSVSVMFSSGMTILTTALLYVYGGLASPTTCAYLLCIIMGSLLLGGRGAIVFTGLSVAGVAWLWYTEQLGWLPPVGEGDLAGFSLLAYSAIFILGGLLLHYAVNSLSQAIERARRNERAQRQTNRELEALRASLEDQVTERTHDLERRSAYLEASLEVGRTATSTLDSERLMQQVVELIHQRFNLYHSSIFLLDDSGEWAILHAGSGEAGQRLREQGFRLEVGGGSMIGWCTAHTQARVSQNVHQAGELERVDHPLLSEVQSEAALPLIARGRIIGALSAMSSQPDDFDQVVVAILQSMADQLAVAVDNARLFAESQTALEAERRAYGQISRQAWSEALRSSVTAGYSYNRTHQRLTPITDSASRPATGDTQELTRPVKVRDQTIGLIDVYMETPADSTSVEKKWTAEEIALLDSLAEQLGVALESARLYQDTQRSATRERLIGEITDHMRETLDMDKILQTAAYEIRHALGLHDVTIRMGEQE